MIYQVENVWKSMKFVSNGRILVQVNWVKFAQIMKLRRLKITVCNIVSTVKLLKKEVKNVFIDVYKDKS